MSIEALIDLSHWNGLNLDFAAAKQDGIVAVIHKATQGQAGVDPMYATNKLKALDAGMLWGAYHFITANNGPQQAEHFLDLVQPDNKTLIAVDYEFNPAGSTARPPDLLLFIDTIRSLLNRLPVLYSGAPMFQRSAITLPVNSPLRQCPLWWAQYAAAPTLIPTGIWPEWTLWQASDGLHGPHARRVEGIGFCDLDFYNGSLEQLQACWPDLAPGLVPAPAPTP